MKCMDMKSLEATWRIISLLVEKEGGRLMNPGGGRSRPCFLALSPGRPQPPTAPRAVCGTSRQKEP